MLAANTTVSQRCPSQLFQLQLVEPGVWPGMAMAVTVTSPKVMRSPSRTARMLRGAGKRSNPEA
jgi:hypothetical protein